MRIGTIKFTSNASKRCSLPALAVTCHLLALSTMFMPPCLGQSSSACGSTTKFEITVRARQEDLYDELTDLDFGRLQPDVVPSASVVNAKGNKKDPNGKTRTLANFFFDMSGIDYSKEGADLTLEKFGEVRSEYTRQCDEECKRWDSHKKACLAILELADAIGTNSALSAVSKPFETLVSHLGKGHAERILDAVVRIKDYPIFNEGPAIASGFSARDDLAEQLIGYSLDTDVIYQDLTVRLRAFSNKTSSQRTGSKVTYSALNLAAMVPTIVAPIAGTSQMGAVFFNGGPEVDKLLKVACLSKLLERRKALLSCKVRSALEGFEKADRENNKVLKHASATLLRRVCGGNYLARIEEKKANYRKSTSRI